MFGQQFPDHFSTRASPGVHTSVDRARSVGEQTRTRATRLPAQRRSTACVQPRARLGRLDRLRTATLRWRRPSAGDVAVYSVPVELGLPREDIRCIEP